jgi:hypothetical protein
MFAKLKMTELPEETGDQHLPPAKKEPRGGIMRAYSARQGALPELLKVPAYGAAPLGKMELETSATLEPQVELGATQWQYWLNSDMM